MQNFYQNFLILKNNNKINKQKNKFRYDYI